MTMKSDITSTNEAYTATTVVSSMVQDGEKKDQDRARWFEPGQVACIGDGVSSSPNSAKAAEIITQFVPSLFCGNLTDRLEMLCDVLIAQRRQCQLDNEINLPEGTSESMRQMLLKVVQSKKAVSFQSTMIAAQFTAAERTVFARVIKCGDSAFFAFSPDGNLLTSSLSVGSLRRPAEDSRYLSGNDKAILFGPGREILVRVDGPLSEYKGLAEQSGIRPEHEHNWIVCSAIDSCQNNETESQNLLEVQPIALQRDHRLLIPRYLYGQGLTSEGQQYRILSYSSAVKRLFGPKEPIINSVCGGVGSTTLVLPDHFYTGAYESYRDSFPRHTHFLLCSDGFYGAFSNWSELCQWLKENAAALDRKGVREVILKQLHERLNARKGDDDISFIWVRPRDVYLGGKEVNYVSKCGRKLAGEQE